MKLLFILLILFSAKAFAESETGVISLRIQTEEEIEPQIREVMKLVKKGRYRGPHYNCNSKGRVYAVDVPGLRYRTDRDGNIEAFFLAHLKYRCR
jgi:hypothetical protein